MTAKISYSKSDDLICVTIDGEIFIVKHILGLIFIEDHWNQTQPRFELKATFNKFTVEKDRITFE